MAAFSTLDKEADDDGLSAVILDVAVSSSTRFGCFSTRDFDATIRGPEIQLTLQASVRDTATTFFGDAYRDLAHSLEELRQLRRILEEKCSNDGPDTPAFSSMTATIRKCLSVVKQLARQRSQRNDGTAGLSQFLFEDGRVDTVDQTYQWANAAYILPRTPQDAEAAASQQPYLDENVQFTLYRPQVVVPARWFRCWSSLT
jgi:hypothetical protein